MSDEINNDDPSSQQPGWAAPDQGATPPPAPTPPPVPPQPDYPQQPPAAPQPPSTPPPEYTQPMPQQGYQAADPYAAQGMPQYSQPGPPKKKRKLWLWITLAIVIPLFLCGLGIGGCAFWLVSTTKPAVDATNNFYKAAKEGKNLDPYTCKRFLNQGGSFNSVFKDGETTYGKIRSYDFTSVNNDNGAVSVKGRVTRDETYAHTEVDLDKDNGKYKVCTIHER